MKKFFLEMSIIALLLAAIVAGQHFNEPMRGKLEPIPDPISSVGEPAFGASEPRSPEWPRVRAEHLKQHPECAACGWKGIGKEHRGLVVHHLRPFHIAPELELSPDNLVTACGSDHWNCHFRIFHLGRWDCWNEHAIEDAAYFRKRLESRKCD